MSRRRRSVALVAAAMLAAAPEAPAHPRARKKSQAARVGEVLAYQTSRKNRDVRDAVQDAHGVVWAVDGAGSFLVLKPGSDSWRRRTPGADGVPRANFQRLCLFAGGVWVGTAFSGLAVHAAGTWSTRKKDQGLSSNMVRDLTVHLGDLWVATSGGLDVFDPAEVRPRAVQLPAGASGSPAALASLGDRLLMATNKGELWVRQGQAWAPLVQGGGLGGRSVKALAAAGDHVWVGTFGGLYRVGLEDGAVAPLEDEDPELANVVVTDLALRGEEVWVATLGAGLLRRSEVGWSQYVPPYSPLGGDNVRAVHVTGDGEVLAATDRGLTRITLTLEPSALVDVRRQIPLTDVPEATDVSRAEPTPRQILHTQAGGSEMSPLAALGDILFEDPTVLGEKAQRMGMSCGTCHPSGHMNTNFFIQGLSTVRGGVDLTHTHFSAGMENGIHDPTMIPSLRGVRYTAPYGWRQQAGTLRDFIRNVVVLEFDGPEPPPKTLDALTAYVREFDFLPTRWVREDGTLSPEAPAAVQRGAELFRRPFEKLPQGSCAACHPPAGFFTDGRMYDVGTGEGFDTPTLRNANYSAPYMHDGRFATYRQVVDHFDQLYEMGLTPAEKRDLVAYLDAVGEGIQPYESE